MIGHHTMVKRFCLAAVCAMLAACAGKTQEAGREAVTVGTVVVHNGTVQSHRSYVGTVEEASTTPVSFGVGGRITAIHVRDGQHVKAGDLLATIDSRDATNACAAAEAALEQARDGYARAKQVYDKGSLPEIKWVEVQTRYNQARNAYDIAKRRLDDCSLYAPVGGTVERVLVESGTHAAPGVPVLNIVNTSSLFVRMSIPEVDVNQIGMGSKVVVDISALPDSTGMALPGVVAERDVTADVVAHSYSFRVRLQRTPKGLLPGMVCSCRLPATVAGEGFELPERAVQLANDDSRYVWIVKEGKARRQSISVADLTRTGVLISNGLQDGDTVIVDGMLKVSEGMTVNPTVK